MIRASLFLAATMLATPALAQHQDHVAPAAPAPTASCTPEHAAMGHCKLPEPAPKPAAPACSAEHAAMGHCKLPEAAAKPAAPACSAEHAAMGHCKLPEPVAEPVPAAPAASTSCPPEHAAMGHCKPADADPHAGHDMGGAAQSEVPPGPAPAEASSGPVHAADAVWDTGEMVRARGILRKEHGDMTAAKVLVDRAEQQFRKGRDGYVVDAQGWIGGDIDKLWLKSEVEGDWGRKLESAELQALWSHAITPWFDLQAGVRTDVGEGPNRTHLVLGVQGLMPYWFEIDGALFLSTKGELTARAEAEYDLRITQKLILQPRVELGLSAQKVDELGLGSGLTDAALGARLRYEISPLFAPYAGLEYERAFGATRDFLRSAGQPAGGLKVVAGIRAWF